MPTLLELRQRAASTHSVSRMVPHDHVEAFVSDRRSQMTPKQMVESKLGQALAVATQKAMANLRDQ